MRLRIINLTSTHSKLSKNVYVCCIIPSSLFTTILFKRAKTVRRQEPSAPFCGVLNEIRIRITAQCRLKIKNKMSPVTVRLKSKCLENGMKIMEVSQAPPTRSLLPPLSPSIAYKNESRVSETMGGGDSSVVRAPDS